MQHQRQILRITAALLSIALFGLNSSFAQVLWTGTTSVNDDWFTPTNWTGSTIPADTDEVRLNSGSTEADPIVINNSGTTALANTLTIALIGSDSGYLEIRSDLTVTGLFQMRSGTGTVTQLSGTVSAGEINTGSRDGTFTYVLNGSSAVLQTAGAGDFYVARGDGNTEFQHDAGTVTVGKNMYWGNGSYTGGSGKYLMTSGSLTVVGKMVVGWKSDGQSFEQSGGTATFGSVVAGGDTNDEGVGTIRLSEGAQFTSSGLMRIADNGTANGTGTLILDGSKTGAGTDLIAEDDFQLNNLGTLNVVIDNDAITLASNMRKVDITQDIVFELGSLLLPEFGSGVTPTAGTWIIAEWDGSMTNGGLALDPGTAAGWSFDASDISKTLTVTYVVPEPSAVLLLIGGLSAVMLVRRRR